MFNRSVIKFTLLFLIVILAPGGALAAVNVLHGKTVWTGDVTLSESVSVPAGAELRIAAGTIVRIKTPDVGLNVSGLLLVNGTEAKPVRFLSPPGWKGISFLESKQKSLIEHAVFAKADAAISSIATRFTVRHTRFTECGTAIKLLRESPVLIEDSLFEKNDIAVDNEMKSVATIRNSRFIGQKKTAVIAAHNSRGLITGNLFENNLQGIALKQPYNDRISNNIFRGNKIAIYCNQTKNTPLIKGNRFEKNETALINFSFAYPAVEDNHYIENTMAIRNDQYGSPLVQHNLFRNNATAIYNYRKSSPVVERNLIEDNDLALYCDYSSYPRVRENHFVNNKVAVELGIYQSADWEKRSGSMPLMQKEAAARKSKNPLIAQAPTTFNDVVDVSGNWWGEGTKQLQAASINENLSIFFDRKDKERVVYEGFGPESYLLDWVEYRPWLKQPVETVGPRSVQ
jgi:parallel beta-helix repeat protein